MPCPCPPASEPAAPAFPDAPPAPTDGVQAPEEQANPSTHSALLAHELLQAPLRHAYGAHEVFCPVLDWTVN